MEQYYSLLKNILQQRRVVVWGCFILLLVLGLIILPDYNVSTDEPQQRNIGLVSLNYLGNKFFPSFIQSHNDFKGVSSFANFPDRDYGVAFELPLAWLEQVLGIKEWRNLMLFRHLCTFLVNMGGVAAMYQLSRRRFQSWRLGLFAAALLVLSPRIFADLFYNDKDLIFLSIFTIATNTAVAFVVQPSWRRAGWHALACACAIDVRIMGILLPAATLALVGLQTARGAYSGQRLGLKLVAYLGLLITFVVLFWPFLWEAPLANFVESFRNMSRFRWEGYLLYAGHLVLASKLPWHYAEVWIGITTPLLYLVGFGVGTFLTLRQLVRRGWQLYATAEEWQDLLFLGLTLAPLLAVIVLHSVLYNAWRQLYFVYPPLLLLAVRGLVALVGWRPARANWARNWPSLCYATLAVSMLATAGQMMVLHPYEHAYFNLLAGAHIEERYEIDYWVMSYREGLEWIARHDNRSHILISAQRKYDLENARRMLLPNDRDRMEVIDDSMQASYYLTTYYQHPQPYEEYAFELATVRRNGLRLLSIFRTKW